MPVGGPQGGTSQQSLYTLALLLAGWIVLLLGLKAREYRDGTAPDGPFDVEEFSRVDWFVMLVWTDAIWALATAATIRTRDPHWHMLFDQVRSSMAGFAAVWWLLFALAYTGRRRWITRRTVGVAVAVPLGAAVLNATNPLHGLAWRRASVEVVSGIASTQYAYGPAFLVVIGLVYLFIVAGMVLLVETALGTDRLYADQSLALVVGALAPLVVSVLVVTDWGPLPPFDVTPLALVVTGVANGYALFRTRLFEAGPSVYARGEKTAMDALQDGAVIVDSGDRIVQANPAAEAVLSTSPDRAVGRPLEDALGVESEGIPESGRGEVRSADGRRVYDVQVSPVSDGGESVGRVFVFRDVTGREERRERLQVLNRTLRHNLRNRLNVVEGHADLLVDQLETAAPDARPRARKVREETTDLVDLVRKVRRYEGLVAMPADPVESELDLGLLVQSVVEDVAEQYPDVTYDNRVGNRIVVSDRSLLEPVVFNLVENAAEHNDADDPVVEVTVESAADGECLRVADNGPGIPDHERASIESGEETPLEHGSGIGLWMVRWGMRKLGGEFRIGESDLGGALVELSIPCRADEVDDRDGDVGDFRVGEDDADSRNRDAPAGADAPPGDDARDSPSDDVSVDAE